MIHRLPVPALEDEVKLLRALQRTGAMIAAKLDVRGVAQAVIDAAVEASGAQSVALCLRGERDRAGSYDTAWEVPARAGDDRGAPLPIALDGDVFISADLAADPRREAIVGDAALGAVHSYLVAPVVVRGEHVIGCIVLGHRARGVFIERTARLAAGIAAQAASALHNARVHDQIVRISEERARLLDLERAARRHHEQRRAETDARLSRLAHDLRAPLNAIVGWSDMLLREDAAGDHRRGIEVIARNARAQAELLAQLGAPSSAQTPAVIAEATPVVTARSGPIDISLAGKRVLVIDDDHDTRALLKAILSDARADAVTAASADEGLVLLRQLRPDVIVSDIGMALRDGYQFMRLVRTMPPADGGRTPALAFTAFVDAGARALLAGYQEHIAKPVHAEQLVAAVQRLASLPT